MTLLRLTLWTAVIFVGTLLVASISTNQPLWWIALLGSWMIVLTLALVGATRHVWQERRNGQRQ